jgi:hypothetical protein
MEPAHNMQVSRRESMVLIDKKFVINELLTVYLFIVCHWYSPSLVTFPLIQRLRQCEYSLIIKSLKFASLKTNEARF